MVIRGRAPLRVSFGGGGTDVAPFCEQQGGAIIGSTINKYAYCSIVPREDDQIIVHSLDFDMTVKYNTNENYVYDGRLDLVTAALKAMDIKQGCEVYLQCDARITSYSISFHPAIQRSTKTSPTRERRRPFSRISTNCSSL